MQNIGVLNRSFLLKQRGNVDDTIKEIKRIILENFKSVKPIALKLKGSNRKETFQNIWNYVRSEVNYQNDDPGVEQLRRPLRSLYDEIGDCDDMSILIASLLLSLDITPTLNIAAYSKKGEFSHIYVSTNDEEGNRFVIDTVPEIPYFSYEELPIVDIKKIKIMKIEELAGLTDDIIVDAVSDLSDPSGLMGIDNGTVTDEDMEEFILGNIELVDENEPHDIVLQGADRNTLYENTLLRQMYFARKGIINEQKNPHGLSQHTNMDLELEIADTIIGVWNDPEERNMYIAKAIEQSIYKNFYRTLANAFSEIETELNGSDEPFYVYVDRGENGELDELDMDDDELDGRRRDARRAKKQAKKQARKQRRKDRKNKHHHGGPNKPKGGFIKKLGEAFKKHNPASAGMRLAFLSILATNFGGYGVKTARTINRGGKNASLLKAKWEKMGGKYSALKKAAFKSHKAKNLKGLGELGTIVTAAGAVFTAIANLLDSFGGKEGDDKGADDQGDQGNGGQGDGGRGNQGGQGDGGRGNQGDGDQGTPKRIREVSDPASPNYDPTDPDYTPASDKSDPDYDKKKDPNKQSLISKAQEWAAKNKKALIFSVIGVIVIIAIVIVSKSIAKKKALKKKRHLSGLKGARTRKKNKALKGYDHTEKKKGQYTTRVVYTKKKPNTKTTGLTVQKSLPLKGQQKQSAAQKRNISRMKKAITRAKQIRKAHPRMKWQNAVKEAYAEIKK